MTSVTVYILLRNMVVVHKVDIIISAAPVDVAEETPVRRHMAVSRHDFQMTCVAFHPFVKILFVFKEFSFYHQRFCRSAVTGRTSRNNKLGISLFPEMAQKTGVL